jgi:hydroxymethylpyrimidine/phosphomethylpyrimidine kinase
VFRRPPPPIRIALTIAGSDSIAGAGVQADLKTFAAFGIYGVSAITAVTSQSTVGVSDVFALPPEVVRSQIEQVNQDVEISAVKTGMLATAEIVALVADVVGRFRVLNLVIDPVMAAAAGARTLLAPEAVSVLKTRLFPIASVVTPNVAEAMALSGTTVDSLDSAREAAKRIVDLGPAAVVIKGGHLAGTHATDLLFHAGKFTEFTAPRFMFGPIHGTGCTFASAIAARLAVGDDISEAVQRAKHYVTGAIEHSVEIGRGARVLDHFWDGGAG